MSTNTLGSNLGTGGMETKLIAAEISTAAGVTTVITSSKDPQNIFDIIEWDLIKTRGILSESTTEPRIRPPHTVFTASPEPTRDLKAWTSHTLNPSGTVVISAGAHYALSKRESGGQLLAVGVVAVIGTFAAGQAVRICVRQVQAGNEESDEEERTAYQKALDTPNGAHSESRDELAEDMGSELNRIGISGWRPHGSDCNGKVGEISEADVTEVGRGLANYNSAQIMAVRGLNRCVFHFHCVCVTSFVDTEILVLSCPMCWVTRTLNTLWKTSPFAFLPFNHFHLIRFAFLFCFLCSSFLMCCGQLFFFHRYIILFTHVSNLFTLSSPSSSNITFINILRRSLMSLPTCS